MHFVIGDLHGMLDPLLRLLKRLPREAAPIFCGDLIDRGPHGAQVVELVRKRGYPCARGNHEESFIAFFRDFFAGMELEALISKWWVWLTLNGGNQTLSSYGFWRDPKDPRLLARIRSDLEWMESLPLAIELQASHPSGLPVVVSHSNVTKVWRRRHEDPALFKETALRTRDLECDPSAGIFNIFGHTPLPLRRLGQRCVDVDGGCCYQKEGLGRLVAYWVEEDRFIEQACHDGGA